MAVTITGNADPREAQAYVDYLQEKYNRKLETLDINIDGDFADLDYTFSHVPFERIRRITGYLVGDHGQLERRQESRRARSCETFRWIRAGRGNGAAFIGALQRSLRAHSNSLRSLLSVFSANRLAALRAERRFSPASAGSENATAVAVSRNAYTPTGYRLLAVRFAKRIAIGSPGKMATD